MFKWAWPSSSSLTPLTYIHSRLSPRIFEKIRNDPNGIVRDPGDIEIWKKTWSRKISCQTPFKFFCNFIIYIDLDWATVNEPLIQIHRSSPKAKGLLHVFTLILNVKARLWTQKALDKKLNTSDNIWEKNLFLTVVPVQILLITLFFFNSFWEGTFSKKQQSNIKGMSLQSLLKNLLFSAFGHHNTFFFIYVCWLD